MSPQMQARPGVHTSNGDVRILDITVGHTFWYWCHFPGEPAKLKLSVQKGMLLFGGKKIPVGLNLAERPAQQWLYNASPEQCRNIRTVKITADMDAELLEKTPNCQALECTGTSEDGIYTAVRLFKHLKMLCISSGSMEDFSGFSKRILNLRRLVITDCEPLKKLDGLQNLKRLRRFDLISCDNVWELDPLSFVKTLQILIIRNSESVHTLNPVGVLHELKSLETSRCKQIRDISPLRELAALRHLDLSDCPRLTDISVISELQGINELRLFGCRNVKDLRPLYNMQNMRKISMPPNVTGDHLSMFCITHREKLAELDMRNCTELEDISPLGGLKNLRKLKLSGCTNIKDISSLANLSKLLDLDLADCVGIRDLAPLLALDNLRNLDIGGCANLDRAQIEQFELQKPQCNVHYV